MRVFIEFNENESTNDFLQFLRRKMVEMNDPCSDYKNNITRAKFDLELEGCLPTSFSQETNTIELDFGLSKHIRPNGFTSKVELQGEFIKVKEKEQQQFVQPASFKISW